MGNVFSLGGRVVANAFVHGHWARVFPDLVGCELIGGEDEE